jgi:hypothetical protein
MPPNACGWRIQATLLQMAEQWRQLAERAEAESRES